MEVQGVEAEEGQEELQGQGASRGQRHVCRGPGQSQTGLWSAGVCSDSIVDAGDMLGWL
jgi:hypothetical protein